MDTLESLVHPTRTYPLKSRTTRTRAWRGTSTSPTPPLMSRRAKRSRGSRRCCAAAVAKLPPARGGLDMAAHDLELHHRVPRCLLRLHDRAVSGELDGAGIEAWLAFEHEAMRYGVDVEISREDLAELVEASAVLLARDKHRNGHQSDWQRWGRRGGLETARRYGSSWFALLALRRWGRISPADLDALAKASRARS
jgi:hypothetical protein